MNSIRPRGSYLGTGKGYTKVQGQGSESPSEGRGQTRTSKITSNRRRQSERMNGRERRNIKTAAQVAKKEGPVVEMKKSPGNPPDQRGRALGRSRLSRGGWTLIDALCLADCITSLGTKDAISGCHGTGWLVWQSSRNVDVRPIQETTESNINIRLGAVIEKKKERARILCAPSTA